MTAPATKPRKTARTAAQTAARRWLLRFGVALAAGIVLGGGGGVFMVNKLEPGRPNSVDSVQALLDSIARGRITPVDSGRPPEAAPASTPNPDTTPTPEEQVILPSLVDLEEGAARTAILDAGLQVGEVRFQSSTKPAGTVIASIPDAGTAVARSSAVALVLSDGRPPTDTMPSLQATPSVSSPPPSSRFDFRP